MPPKVFVSGCYDLLHSGHVEFFKQASQYGDLYVGIGSDKTILHYKNHKTVYSEQERLFMVKSIRYVKDAFINDGDGIMDFVGTVDRLKPDIFVVNSDGWSDVKKKFCEDRGIEYIVLERTPQPGLQARSSTDLKKTTPQLPTRLDLAGTWIDQPYVSCFAPGWAITISLEPSFEVRDRCGLSTSTRKVIQKIWPYQLPINMDPEMLARLVFCFENNPEREDGIISGAQDSIGICMPGLCRHYYNNHFWPEKIESCQNEETLIWLESHLCMIPINPRPEGCSVIEGRNITQAKVKALAYCAEKCWSAIMYKDFEGFVQAYKDSFAAQTAMFPGMITPFVGGKLYDNGVQDAIDRYSNLPEVHAWKMPGAGGGGYLALVVDDAGKFVNQHPESFIIKIRRAGM